MMLRPLFFAAACMATVTCVTAAATPAFADVLLVSTRGVDLASPDGRAALDRRVTAAASRMCVTNGLRPLAELTSTRRCMADAVASTRSQLAALPGPATALAR